MDTESSSFPMPVCEVCWLIDNTVWEPESMDENGQVVMRMTGIVVPDKINTGDVDVCGLCGSITISGIYQLQDSEDVPSSDADNSEEQNIYKNDEYDPTMFRVSLADYEDDDEEQDERY